MNCRCIELYLSTYCYDYEEGININLSKNQRLPETRSLDGTDNIFIKIISLILAFVCGNCLRDLKV